MPCLLKAPEVPDSLFPCVGPGQIFLGNSFSGEQSCARLIGGLRVKRSKDSPPWSACDMVREG